MSLHRWRFLAISINLKLLVFSSDYTVESPSFQLSHEGPMKLHPVPEQLTVVAKLDSMDYVAIVDSLSSDSSPSLCAPIKRSKLASIRMTVDLKTNGPLSYSESGSCDHNGGVLTSKYGDLIVTIPKGAIKEGDLVTLSLASDLYGPFVLPSKHRSDVVSPYYWIGVSELYHFQMPVQVEFEHFAVVTACDPSHYQLLCCEDDNESYTMRPAVGCNLRFTVRDDISWCAFNSDNFCSYCLLHGCKDPGINRIAALYLKSENYQYLTHFTAEIWFSLNISLCLKRNKELYTNQGMVLDHTCSCNFEAACDKNSTSYFTLTYPEDVNGWDLKCSRFKNIKTKDINFYNNYQDSEHLKTNEDNSLFPERFVVNVTKNPGCNAELNTDIIVTLHENEGEILKSVSFLLLVQTSAYVQMIIDTNRLSVTDSVAQIGATNTGTFLLDYEF